jgi:hypothetical protein
MEANFDTTKKIIYGQRMLHQARMYKLIPEEIYSEQNRLADDRTLAQVLFYDIVHQTWLPVGISKVNANNCYDQIAHPIALLVFQALGFPQEAIVSFLSTIQDMIFFLHTGFGDSKVYLGLTNAKKMQGLCQGNGAAPVDWTVTSIKMLKAHKRKGHGVQLNCSNLFFDRFYLHVCAHQDDKEDYQDLSRPFQLNVNNDFNAKQALLDLQPTNLPCQ